MSQLSPIISPKRGLSKPHFGHWFDGLNPLDRELGDNSNGEQVEHGDGDTLGHVAVGWAGDGHRQARTSICPNDLHL